MSTNSQDSTNSQGSCVRHRVWFSSIMQDNGWIETHTKRGTVDPGNEAVYGIKITAEHLTCHAYVRHSGRPSEIGVFGIQVFPKDNEPYDRHRCGKLFNSISAAERNLLIIGVPFVPSYEFSPNIFYSESSFFLYEYLPPLMSNTNELNRRRWGLDAPVDTEVPVIEKKLVPPRYEELVL